MEIKYDLLKDVNQITTAFEYMKQTNKPFAFIIKKGTFETYKKEKAISKYELTREKAIQTIISLMNNDDIVVSTTGMISRELYENRDTHEKDFLTVGSMGHASSIALGIAINKPNRNVICFDGDGAFLMHMGAIPVIASLKQENIKHIIFNNESHDSVGAQPTVCKNIDIKQIALSSGYNKAFSVSNEQDIKDIWKYFYSEKGTNLLEIKVNCGARDNLARPKEKPKDNKELFMNFIRG
jgi:phosphonopyruvate decarboxylase